MSDEVTPTARQEDNPIVRAIQHGVRVAVAEAREHDAENLRQIKKTAFGLKKVVVALVIIVVSSVYPTTWSFYQAIAHPTDKQIHQELIGACNSGNSSRESNIKAWNRLIQIFGSADANSPKVKEFLSYVASINADRDCAAEYSGSANTPTPPAQASVTSAYHQTEALVLWDNTDGCLSFRGKPVAGAPLNHVACDKARVWQYYPVTGQMRPNANLGLAAGDVRGKAVLVSASNTGASTINIGPWQRSCDYLCSTFFFAGHPHSNLYDGAGNTILLNGKDNDRTAWGMIGYSAQASKGIV